MNKTSYTTKKCQLDCDTKILKQIKTTYVTSKFNLNRKLKRPAFKALNKYTLKLYRLSLLKSSSLGTSYYK